MRAAVDFDAFYAERVSASDEQHHGNEDVLVLSADGKEIVMRSEVLREATARAAQRASPKLKTRLSKGEKSGRKRVAAVGAVYEITAAPRTSARCSPPPRSHRSPLERSAAPWLPSAAAMIPPRRERIANRPSAVQGHRARRR